MRNQEAYYREVKRIMEIPGAFIPRDKAEMLAAVKFWPDYCPHCGERREGPHHPECPVNVEEPPHV